ncbi:hypothetical protein Ddye_000674 [Dipteronia dyeriana]|uniref:Uncharacterized protein n=1 Tax=Dipteronia dyeriana TaxID=168575 RepID=A0AAD9XME2_9ROSI|nr:hypothetical protein Ddye_000674 [Dipteronia dyeriana]
MQNIATTDGRAKFTYRHHYSNTDTMIYLSAYGNKLSDIKEQANEYAALPMEELDTGNLEYITYRYRATYEVMGHRIYIAKGVAETLKFNVALILLPVYQNTITWLRNKTKLSVVVPFDDNFSFHKVVQLENLTFQ